MRDDDSTTGGGTSDEAGCGHPLCSCLAGPSGYCSAECEAEGDGNTEDGPEACACGHADCEAQVVDLSDEAG